MSDPTVRIERVLPAPPEEVFAAWTDPVMLHGWMSPTGHAEAEVDARVGGRFRIVMVAEGVRIEHTGEYLLIDPPRRLSFTWVSPYARDSVVTVTLFPHDDGTLLRLSHERLRDEHVQSHEGGWGKMLARLASLVTAAEPSA